MVSVKSRLIAACAVAVLLAGSIAGKPTLAGETQMQRTVTVSASGSVEVEPDAAQVSAGAVSEARTAREALKENSALMDGIISGLKDLRIDAADIQTSSFNVNPQYTNSRDGRPAVIRGYQVSNQVEVVVRDLDQLGQILDQLVGLGANQIRGLSFIVTDAETVKDAARKKAIENARRRAELYAEAAGASVGSVVTISENAVHGGPRPVAMGRAAFAESVPVERGTETLQANVTVTWALE